MRRTFSHAHCVTIYWATVFIVWLYIYIFIYSRTDAFTLSGFTTAFKAALNEQDSTRHRVAYIIMMGLMHSQRRRRRNDLRSF